MTVFQLLPSISARASWTPVQAQRARARMLKPWQYCLAQCHGVWALELSQVPLPLTSLRMAKVWRYAESFQASRCLWPIQPGCLDLVLWRLSAEDVAELPALMSQMALSLGPAARVLIWIEAPLLNSWCQTGMPLCSGHDWVLREAEWGDARPLTLLPARWSRKWSSALQTWVPNGAQWSVQLWQRETICTNRPALRRWKGRASAAGLGWQPQSSIDHSK